MGNLFFLILYFQLVAIAGEPQAAPSDCPKLFANVNSAPAAGTEKSFSQRIREKKSEYEAMKAKGLVSAEKANEEMSNEMASIAEEHLTKNGFTVTKARTPRHKGWVLEITGFNAERAGKVMASSQTSLGIKYVYDPLMPENGNAAYSPELGQISFSTSAIQDGFKKLDGTLLHEIRHAHFSSLLKQGIETPYYLRVRNRMGKLDVPGLEMYGGSRVFSFEELTTYDRALKQGFEESWLNNSIMNQTNKVGAPKVLEMLKPRLDLDQYLAFEKDPTSGRVMVTILLDPEKDTVVEVFLVKAKNSHHSEENKALLKEYIDMVEKNVNRWLSTQDAVLKSSTKRFQKK